MHVSSGTHVFKEKGNPLHSVKQNNDVSYSQEIFLNPEKTTVPQIRTKLDSKQGLFTQVKIHTSVFISYIQVPQVLTFGQ